MKLTKIAFAVALALLAVACGPKAPNSTKTVDTIQISKLLDTQSEDCPYCVNYNVKIEYPVDETARLNLLDKFFADGEDISYLELEPLVEYTINRASQEDMSFLEEMWTDHKKTGYRFTTDTLSHSICCSFMGTVNDHSSYECVEDIFLGTAHPDITCRHAVLDAQGKVCTLDDILKPGYNESLVDTVKQVATDFIAEFGIAPDFFDDVQFFVSQDFFFSEDGLVFYYDKGIFGGWAIPGIEACVPWETIKPYLAE